MSPAWAGGRGHREVDLREAAGRHWLVARAENRHVVVAVAAAVGEVDRTDLREGAGRMEGGMVLGREGQDYDMVVLHSDVVDQGAEVVDSVAGHSPYRWDCTMEVADEREDEDEEEEVAVSRDARDSDLVDHIPDYSRWEVHSLNDGVEGEARRHGEASGGHEAVESNRKSPGQVVAYAGRGCCKVDKAAGPDEEAARHTAPGPVGMAAGPEEVRTCSQLRLYAFWKHACRCDCDSHLFGAYGLAP